MQKDQTIHRKVRYRSSIILGTASLLIVSCLCPVIGTTFPVSTPSPASVNTQSLEPDNPPAGQFPPRPIDLQDVPFSYSWNDRQPFARNLINAALSSGEDIPFATEYHIAMSFADPPSQAIGIEEIRYTNAELVELDEIVLGLFPNILGGEMAIQRVFLNGSYLAPKIDGWLLRIGLEDHLQPGESLLLRIEFTITIPTNGNQSYYGILGLTEGVLSLAHAYPTILVHNRDGWNDQAPDLDGDPLFSDASYYLVLVDAPVDLVIVASGIELTRSEIDSRQRMLFANGPARDFYLAASDSMEMQSELLGETEIRSFSAPEKTIPAKQALDYARSSLELFSQRYGLFPYSEFDMVPIITSAGGVEYPGMTAVSSDVYSWGDYLETVVVHEVAHQWFYNLVGNDTLDSPWLDESLAQFATWQYYLDRYGPERADLFARMELQSNWDMASDPDLPIGLPVRDYELGFDYAAIVYGRGPFFFMRLRDTMGIPAFDAFLKDYVRLYTWGIATPVELRSAAESACQCDLSSLFAEWVEP